MIAPMSKPARIGPADEALLTALGTYVHLTADQLTRRSYSPNSKRHVQKKLAGLVSAGLVEKHRGYSRDGKPPDVYAPSTVGWQYLERLGLSAPSRWRPAAEANRGFTQYRHDLAIADFGIAAERLCQLTQPTIRHVRFIHDRFLPQTRVQLSDGSRQEVRIDAFLELRIKRGDPPRSNQRCLALELDRSSEYQLAFRTKIAGLLAYIEGGYYQAQFDTISLTYVFVCPGDPERVKHLRAWTKAELKHRGATKFAPFFVFTAADPATADPVTFFVTDACWFIPGRTEPSPLLAPPPAGGLALTGQPHSMEPEAYLRFLHDGEGRPPEIAPEPVIED